MERNNLKCLTVFSKNPYLTKVKTRLKLEDDYAAELYRCFLLDTIKRPLAQSVDKYIHLYPASSQKFEDEFSEPGFTRLPQSGNHLGERMNLFFEWAYRRGYRKMVLIGSDQPTLPPERIDEAFELLDGFPVVFGPSLDGGYYLVAMREPHPELFLGIPWGGSQVLKATLSRIAGSFGLLEPWYDVDYPEDLEFLKTHLKAIRQSGCGYFPLQTASFLSR